jgi:hypothetical protein
VKQGRAVAQAVSRWIPIAAAWVRAWVRSCGICGRQSGTGTGFLQVPQFSLPSMAPIASHSSSSIIIRGLYKRSVVASVMVDSVPPPPPPANKGKFRTKQNTVPSDHVIQFLLKFSASIVDDIPELCYLISIPNTLTEKHKC